MLQDDHQMICPYCGQAITMQLDLTAGGQKYIEDCEVCCNPIEISYQIREGEVADLQVEASQHLLD